MVYSSHFLRQSATKHLYSSSYCFFHLQKKNLEPSDCHYGYPKEVPKYLRWLVPGDVAGAIMDSAYPLFLETFVDIVFVEVL